MLWLHSIITFHMHRLSQESLTLSIRTAWDFPLSEHSCYKGCRIRVQTHYSEANWGTFTMSNITFETLYLKMQSVPFSFFKDQASWKNRPLKQHCSCNLICVRVLLYYWQPSLCTCKQVLRGEKKNVSFPDSSDCMLMDNQEQLKWNTHKNSHNLLNCPTSSSYVALHSMITVLLSIPTDSQCNHLTLHQTPMSVNYHLIIKHGLDSTEYQCGLIHISTFQVITTMI